MESTEEYQQILDAGIAAIQKEYGTVEKLQQNKSDALDVAYKAMSPMVDRLEDHQINLLHLPPRPIDAYNAVLKSLQS